jgi:glycine/D-amino acid oxidase-like deaminating enzyme
MTKKIIIIGAGIIGASLAYHLAKGGATVTVFDAAGIGGLATPNSWGWINASWGNPEHYVKLRIRAMAEWRALAEVHPNLRVNWCVGLLWDLPHVELEAFAAARTAIGYEAHCVKESEILKLEPNLKEHPEFAVHVPGEGIIEPLTAVDGFVTAARSQVAVFVTHSKILKLLVRQNNVVGVYTAGEFMYADEIVVAAGAQTPALLATIGVRLELDAPSGLLVHLEPAQQLLQGLVMAPEIHVRQTSEGRLVAGSNFSGAQMSDDSAQAANNLFQMLQSFLIGAKNLSIEFYTVGHRPTPKDGMPMIGRPKNTKGLYVAVMHSGITLAPVVGLLVCQDILSEVRDPLLVPYHPERETILSQ